MSSKRKKTKGDVQRYSSVDSPAIDPFENIVATYYQLLGYITSSGKWFWVWDKDKTQSGYQDIDLLAVGAEETIIVSITWNLDDKIRFTKAGRINVKKRDKLRKFFERTERFLSSTPQYTWLVASDRTIRRVVACANWSETKLADIRNELTKMDTDLKTAEQILDEFWQMVKERKAYGLRTDDPLIKLTLLLADRGPRLK